MADLKERLDRELVDLPISPDGFEKTLERVRSRSRTSRLMVALAALALAGAALVLLIRTWSPESGVPADRREDSISPAPFGQVHGWIAYGINAQGRTLEEDGTWTREQGVWAVNPKRPSHPVELNDGAAHPLAWSTDGSKLLIAREERPRRNGVPPRNLFVLNADGSETRLTQLRDDVISGGSFSPDGSKVVYATTSYDHPHESFVWVVDARGGQSRPIYQSNLHLDHAVFSPDGEQIAFVEGGGDHSNKFMVMNSDGSRPQVLLNAVRLLCCHVYQLAWSPDGTRLALAADDSGPGIYEGINIYTFNADGSRFELTIPEAGNFAWSPDGSRIAFVRRGELYTVAADGTDRHKVRPVGGWAWTIAWNPVA
jgi:Tol biopolymer transport system component